ncbi:Kelch-like 18 (Drosophila) [Seminavis robusta]|uniref:Kelch-like 18 (Drosophila) n=1 Tax=Seminavis robusta TaxID=568900 RepID=A0A9N8EPQ7_9STRA|nr:Kelch-like 18 (Drosophila) [Seminavis robusta]|eukprot:Sro1616_g286210.1 Kelch-like 18 (Drosophila) (462) ;mRNA; r:3131-4516
MNNTDNEVPLDKVLSSFLTDEEVHDVTLLANDGTKVEANRFVLSIRSPVFRRMFLGNFSESNKPEVTVGFGGSIMQDIVEYIHTDSCSSLVGKKRKACNENETELWNQAKEHTEKLVGLSTAATYYNLPSLVQKIEKSISKSLESTPSLSLALLAACHKAGPSVPAELAEPAWLLVRTKDDALMSSKAIACVDATLVEKILKDDQMMVHEYNLVLFLVQWFQINPKNRKSIAKELGCNIKLEKINPSLLSDTVASSGLFMSDQIHEAYKNQALHAEQAHSVPFQGSRYFHVWKKSRNTVTGLDESGVNTDTLVCAPIENGIHQWTVKLLKDGDRYPGVVLGIVCTQTSVEDESQLGHRKVGWGLDAVGKSYENGKRKKTKRRGIQAGTEVTLTLNLNPSNEGNGTLNISWENNNGNRNGSHNVVDNLCDHLKSHPGGFLPAVSTLDGARVQFVKMRKLQED